MTNSSIDKKLVESFQSILARYQSIFNDIFDSKTISKIEHGKVSPPESILFNEVLAKKLYGDKIFNLLKKNDLDSLNKLYLKTKKGLYKDKISLMKEILFNNIVIILVRPESYYFWENIEKFIRSNISGNIHSYNAQIDFDQYWLMYNHGLINRNSWMDFPTRTLLYLNNPCKLFVFKLDKENRISDIDHFSDKFKGRMGRPKEHTLRGDLVYNEFLRITSEFFSHKNLVMKILDPLHCYRHLVGGSINCDNAHVSADSPFLFYAGAGIHIPDKNEIEKDLAALCDLDLLNKIKIDLNE